MKRLILLMVGVFVASFILQQVWGIMRMGNVPALENIDQIPAAIEQIARPDPAKVAALTRLDTTPLKSIVGEINEAPPESTVESLLTISDRRETLAKILARVHTIPDWMRETIAPEDIAYYKSQIRDFLLGGGLIRELLKSLVTSLFIGVGSKTFSFLRRE